MGSQRTTQVEVAEISDLLRTALKEWLPPTYHYVKNLELTYNCGNHLEDDLCRLSLPLVKAIIRLVRSLVSARSYTFEKDTRRQGAITTRAVISVHATGSSTSVAGVGTCPMGRTPP
jgi:hypothetical protein